MLLTNHKFMSPRSDEVPPEAVNEVRTIGGRKCRVVGVEGTSTWGGYVLNEDDTPNEESANLGALSGFDSEEALVAALEERIGQLS